MLRETSNKSPPGVDQLHLFQDDEQQQHAPTESKVRRRLATKKTNVSEDRGSTNLHDYSNNNNDDAKKKIMMAPKPTFSSGVTFYPPSDRYWRIGGKWYDFTANDFISRHPGGADVLLMARDRFEDATFVFESHHHNYKKVRAIIQKYEVPESVVRGAAGGLRGRPHGTSDAAGRHRLLDRTPKLLDDDAFYSVMRRRVTEHLKSVGYPLAGPTVQCKILFWTSFVAWLSCYFWLLSCCSVLSAVCTGFTASWLGAFGHNWVHQPKYKLWANLSLDTIGFSSDAWFREHNLQHHMYTNTPWDNHFEGSAPWLVTDPTVERNILQKYVMPYINPLLLSVGLYTNYLINLVEVIKGNEVVTPWKLLLPLEIGAMVYRWGWRGVLLTYLSHAILGVYYFTMALMNHNAEHCLNVKKRNAARDWGEAQLVSSADWAVGMPFWAAGLYLWLNYHTVHHLFPLTDFSHHPAIQRILIKTCKEFGVEYVVKSPVEIYMQMVRTFASPTSLMQEIMVYGGGI
ncbi:hypothetical protein ACHAXR_011759 [Thalassiosira sp. AJA248-18]